MAAAAASNEVNVFCVRTYLLVGLSITSQGWQQLNKGRVVAATAAFPSFLSYPSCLHKEMSGLANQCVCTYIYMHTVYPPPPSYVDRQMALSAKCNDVIFRKVADISPPISSSKALNQGHVLAPSLCPRKEDWVCYVAAKMTGISLCVVVVGLLLARNSGWLLKLVGYTKLKLGDPALLNWEGR